MVKFLKTFFRSKRDLEVALEISLAKCSKWERDLEFTERRLKAAQVLNKPLQKANDAQSAAIASLQRDLAAAHAKLLIQEETPPETLHGAGKGIRKKHTFLSERQRDSAAARIEACVKLEYVAKEYDVSLRTIQRIEKERCWLVS